MYAFLWNQCYPDDRKKFYLFNIRTKQIFELDSKREEINDIMEIIIENKMKKREIISDREFIDRNKEPIQILDVNEIASDKELINEIKDDYAIISSDEE